MQSLWELHLSVFEPLKYSYLCVCAAAKAGAKTIDKIARTRISEISFFFIRIPLSQCRASRIRFLRKVIVKIHLLN